MRLTLPEWLLEIGARSADLAGGLGWSPPIRLTALKEMRRGVTGDPSAWIIATGIEPKPLKTALAEVPATIQERWFARLYLVKSLVLACLSLFWIVSGLIAIGSGYDRALEILVSHGFSDSIARGLTIITSLADISIGVLIALRRTSNEALTAGLALALVYLLSASILTPDLWKDPLGPLVKIAPAIVLTLVALALSDNR